MRGTKNLDLRELIKGLCLAGLFFLILSSSGWVKGSRHLTWGKLTSDMGINIKGLEGFRVEESSIQDLADTSSGNRWEILARRGSDCIRMTVFEQIPLEEAVLRIRSQCRILDEELSSLSERDSMDKGDESLFPAKYLPFSDPTIPLYILRAGDDFPCPIQESSGTEYRLGVTFFLCEADGKLFQIEYFQPNDQFNRDKVLDVLKSFRCPSVVAS